MESRECNKPRGLMKSKLGRTFSKVVTRRSWPQVQRVSNNNKVISLRPSHGPSARNNATTSTVSYLTHHQDLPNVSTTQRVPMMNGGRRDTNGFPFLDYAGDEDVDMKAAQYILYVQERFKQEREPIPTLFN
ncbi:hypothetical protein AB3S75_038255 [Citrus x aurantiifolia]